MKARYLLALTMVLAGCGQSAPKPVTVEDRVRYLESERVDLTTRVSELEKANKEVLDQYAEIKKSRDAEADRIQTLKADQAQVQKGQKLLCDATLDC